MAKISLQNISKRWGDALGVKAMNLEIADGEFLVLLGPSGCGKTTTMRMVAGLEDPSTGDIHIGERNVTHLEPKDRDVAMVFQSYGLYPNMTVAENIAFPLKVRGTPVNEMAPRVDAAAKMVELTDYLHRRPKELSGGQRQRVALARAIVRKPAVFLMDEPLSNLDAKLRVSMRSHIKHLHHQLGVTTIYVTHDQIEAMTLADRVVVMSKAEIQQIGTPEAIYNDPANLFVASFIGNPAMNLLQGRIEADDFVADGGLRVAGVARGIQVPDPKAVVLGVRPEDVQICADVSGDVRAPVFSFELTGDATLVTLRVGQQFVTARGGKDYRCAMDASVSIRLPAEACFLFDSATQNRLRSGAH